MKRVLILLALAIAAAGAVTVAYFTPLLAAPPESEELMPPIQEPAVITPEVPTFMTLTAAMTDPEISRPKLQYYDWEKSKWKTLGKLKDSGKGGNQGAGDRTFTLRVQFYDSNGVTAMSLPKTAGLKTKGVVPSPAQLRLAAKRKGQRGLVVSPSFSVLSVAPSPVAFAGGSASVDVPATFSVIDASDPTHVILAKTGAEGYRVEIVVGDNSAGLPLEPWIFQKAFGFTGPGTPSTFAEYPGDVVEPIQIAGLSGLKVTAVSLQKSVSVFLDDTLSQRVFWFELFGANAGQDLTLDQNLDEALSIVQSLQP